MTDQLRKYASAWSHLFLTGWPFQTTPDETFTQIWADRTAVKQQVERLIWRWSRVDKSTFHVLWADLGAGKTHTLKYIGRHFLDHPESGILPVYTVMPKQMRTFLDVYRVIVAGFDLPLFADMFAKFYRSVGGRRAAVEELFPYMPDTCSALRMVQSDVGKEQLTALEWLRGTPGLTRRQLDPLGICRQIKSTDDAVAILSGLIRLVHLTGTYKRVLIMLDECQRIGNFKLAIGQGINTGLQTWYDSNPNHLTLILSFGSGEERFVRRLLSPELQSREDHLHLSMPLLSVQEATEFIKDLLGCFRVTGAPSYWFPFTEDQVKSIINRVTNSGQIRVTPRVLMKAFDAILSEADFQIGTTAKFSIGHTEVVRIVDSALREIAAEGEELP